MHKSADKRCAEACTSSCVVNTADVSAYRAGVLMRPDEVSWDKPRVAVDTCGRGSGARGLTSARRQSVVVVWGKLILVSVVRAKCSFPSCSIPFSVLISCEQTCGECFQSIYHASSKSPVFPSHPKLAVHPGRAAAY